MSCCSCENWPSAYWEYHLNARKEHICCECNSIIDVGEKYWKFKGIWDDQFMVFKVCDICERLRIEAYRNGYDCIPFECLYETIGSEFEEKIC